MAVTTVIVVLGLSACSLTGTQRATSAEDVVTIAADAAAQTSNENDPPIVVTDAALTGSPGELMAKVEVDLGMTADSWDTAFRAGEYGALLMGEMFENPDVSSARLEFSEQGALVVSIEYSRDSAERVEWDAMVDRVRDSPRGWLGLFTAASAYEWVDALIWSDIATGEYADNIVASELPRKK